MNQKIELHVFDGTWILVGLYDTKKEAREKEQYYKRKGMETYLVEVKEKDEKNGEVAGRY